MKIMMRFGRDTLRVTRAETWLTVGRTYAIRKQLDKKPRENPPKMMERCTKMVELTIFYSMTLVKVHRKRCRAYHEDQYKCIQRSDMQSQRQAYKVTDFQHFLAKRRIRRNELKLEERHKT